MSEILRTSKDWEKRLDGIKVLDPDGWDRSNFDYSFNKELITKEEFDKRLSKSTIVFSYKYPK